MKLSFVVSFSSIVWSLWKFSEFPRSLLCDIEIKLYQTVMTKLRRSTITWQLDWNTDQVCFLCVSTVLITYVLLLNCLKMTNLTALLAILLKAKGNRLCTSHRKCEHCWLYTLVEMCSRFDVTKCTHTANACKQTDEMFLLNDWKFHGWLVTGLFVVFLIFNGLGDCVPALVDGFTMIVQGSAH